jgi:hypothetical protein
VLWGNGRPLEILLTSLRDTICKAVLACVRLRSSPSRTTTGLWISSNKPETRSIHAAGSDSHFASIVGRATRCVTSARCW